MLADRIIPKTLQILQEEACVQPPPFRTAVGEEEPEDGEDAFAASGESSDGEAGAADTLDDRPQEIVTAGSG